MFKKTIITVALFVAYASSVASAQSISSSVQHGGISYTFDLPIFQANNFALHFNDQYVMYELNNGGLQFFNLTSGQRVDRINIRGGLNDDTITVDGVHKDKTIVSIWGYDGNDTITCTTNSVLFAEGGMGNDTITGSNGFRKLYYDILNGGPGNDKIYGRDGRDHIDGGPDNDDLFGGKGMDTVNGGDGWDYIDGGEDDDTLLDVHSPLFQTTWDNAPDQNIDLMYGGPGCDTFYSTHEGYRQNWNGWYDHFQFHDNPFDYSLFAGDKLETNVLSEGLLNFLYPQNSIWP